MGTQVQGPRDRPETGRSHRPLRLPLRCDPVRGGSVEVRLDRNHSRRSLEV
nr:MAG TPA: hypothetical protein [Caudoviricetes sp.]